MSNYMNTPRFIWKIENFSSIKKKLCPATILIGGLKWQLVFSHYMEDSAERNRLLLECLSSSESLPDGQYNVTLAIFNPNGNHFLLKNANYGLKCREWCIWSDSVANLKKHSNQKNYVTVLVTITPIGDVEDLFNNQGSVKELNSESTCMKSLTEDFEKLFIDKEFSDFVLKCGEKRFHVHKCVLSSRSEYFAGMFRSNMKEVYEGIGEVKDLEPDILVLILRYLYTGRVPELSLESLKKVYSAAERFIVEPLKEKCVSLFVDNFINDSDKVNEDKLENGETDVMNTGSTESKENQHLKELFFTREWRSFCQEFPDKVQGMCKHYLLQK